MATQLATNQSSLPGTDAGSLQPSISIDKSFRQLTEPQIARKVLQSIGRDLGVVQATGHLDYVPWQGTKILHNEETYIDQPHERERLLELDMFYRERREFKKEQYLKHVEKRIAEGPNPPRVKKEKKLQSLTDRGQSYRNRT